MTKQRPKRFVHVNNNQQRNSLMIIACIFLMTTSMTGAIRYPSSPLSSLSHATSIGIRSAGVSLSSNPFMRSSSSSSSFVAKKNNAWRRTMIARDESKRIRMTKNNQLFNHDKTTTTTTTRGGGPSMMLPPQRRLLFWEAMVCGAISRSVAQTIMHPANTMKTILQSKTRNESMTLSSLCRPENLLLLTRGAGAQLILSIPHGAVNFAVLEYVKKRMTRLVESRVKENQKGRKGAAAAAAIGPGLDFLSSSISTICCSIISTPQMMITDNIMVGRYPNLVAAVSGLAVDRGLMGFYSGWWPGLAGKIPSYALTWTLFQQAKEAHTRIFQREAKDIENSIMGCLASGATVSIMIPMDTVKTRLVTQTSTQTAGYVPYKGIMDCATRIIKEEGVRKLYSGLVPRLVSVVPMIGIQFGVYEFVKKIMLARDADALNGVGGDGTAGDDMGGGTALTNRSIKGREVHMSQQETC